MADHLELLSVEQLNSAVSLLNPITSPDKQYGLSNIITSMPYCLPQGKGNAPSGAIQNNGPVVVSLNQNPTGLDLAETRSVAQQNFIQSGNCLSLPVVAEDKQIVIGQPVQQIKTIPAFTSCQMSSVVTIPTFTSCQGSSVATSSSTCFQPDPLEMQNSGLLQQTSTISESLPEYALSNNFNSTGQTILPTTTSNLIIGDDGIIQISSGTMPSTQNSLIVNKKPEQFPFTGNSVCKVQQQQQQVVFVANSNNGITLIGNTAGTEQNIPLIFEVLPSSGTLVSSSVSQPICFPSSISETAAAQSMSSDCIQTVPNVEIINGRSDNNAASMSSPITLIDCQIPQVNNVLSNDICPNNSQPALHTIIVKKTLRKCHDGTVLEMVEKLQPVTNLQSQVADEESGNSFSDVDHDLIATGSYCVQCDKMYKEDQDCIDHNSSMTEIPDTPVLTRARMSLPSHLQLKQFNMSGFCQMAVFSREAVMKKTRFGPLIGQSQSVLDIELKENLPMRWKVFDNGQCIKVNDCSQEESSNWMSFMRRANTDAEQNVVAYQQGYDIWFITMTDIPPDTELLYWYSYEYSQLLGVKKRPSDFFKCGVCGKHFENFRKLKSHITGVHAGLSPKKHQCQICSKSFPGKTKLNTHVLSHYGVKPHTCSDCGKQFSDQSNLRLHKDIHTGEKRFHCGQCGRAFRQKAHLTTHYLVHSGEKKLECNYCDKCFARASDLRSHERTMHTQEKKYICLVPNCHKVFHKLSVFKKHMLIHSNKKDFSCAVCKKTFFTKYHLARHAKACKGGSKGKKVKDYPDTSAKQEDSSTDSIAL